MDTVSVFWVLIAALAGVIAGGGSVFAVLSRANKSIELKDSTEKLLAELIPASALNEFSALARRAFDLAERYGGEFHQAVLDSAEFLADVTDQKPNVLAVPLPEGLSDDEKNALEAQVKSLIHGVYPPLKNKETIPTS